MNEITHHSHGCFYDMGETKNYQQTGQRGNKNNDISVVISYI